MTVVHISGYTKGRVAVEGDDLFYEVRGHGQPVLMICGGGGDSWWYYPVADILANHYKVITYDRRANARSTARAPINFEISQQSRDAIAVLHAAGEKSAAVFGSSSGAVIGLDLATRFPQAVQLLILHEPPLVSLHEKARKWRRFFASVHAGSFRYGCTLATLRFALRAGLPLGQMARAAKQSEEFRKIHADEYVSAHLSGEVSMQHELLPVVNYVPDIAALKRSALPVIVGVGAESMRRKRFYAEASRELAGRLGARLATFPGNHISFFHMPGVWAASLLDLLADGLQATRDSGRPVRSA